MKRILIFSVAYHPFVGGAEVAVKEITDRISDYEFEMITLNLDRKQESIEKVGNVMVHRVGSGRFFSKLLFPFVAFMYARKLQQKKPFDAVWSIMANYAGFAALFFKYHFPKISFILTLQEGDPITYIKHRVRFVYPLFKRIFTWADIIQPISHFLESFAKDMGASCPVVVIPNGVDLVLFSKQPDEHEITTLKNTFHKKDNDIFLITTSRLVEKNAVADVIQALTLLPEHILFLIIGIGELENKLRQQVKDLKLENRVQFIGQVAYKDIPKYLAVSDIFIRPSLSEGMGNSFIEAMAAKVPVIATSVGGIPDFLKDTETGIFCKVQNPESIAEKVQLLLANKELKEKIIFNAHKLVVSEYDWNLIAKRMKTEIFAKV
jgi:glycosyltransferase involved in cell wall biosynthesis